MTPDPADPLGIDPLGIDPILDARTRWDAADDTGELPAVPIDQMAPADLHDDVPVATSAGHQDHSDPWRFAGDDAAPPADTGRPADPDIVFAADPARDPARGDDATAITRAEQQRVTVLAPEHPPRFNSPELQRLIDDYTAQYQATFGTAPPGMR